jgi:Leucine-rich repeat (LRR) protein
MTDRNITKRELIDVDADDDYADDNTSTGSRERIGMDFNSSNIQNKTTSVQVDSLITTKTTSTSDETNSYRSKNSNTGVNHGCSSPNRQDGVGQSPVQRAFVLPNGQIMDAKNTLQSFDTIAATNVVIAPKINDPKKNVDAADVVPAKSTTPLNMSNISPIFRGANMIDIKESHYRHNDLAGSNRINTNPTSSGSSGSTSRGDSNNVIIDAVAANSSRNDSQSIHIHAVAVPVHSFAIAEAETFDPKLLEPSPPPPQPQLKRSKAMCIAIILGVTAIAIAAGIGGYCASGQCSKSTTPNAPTMALPVIPQPTVASTIPETVSPVMSSSPPTTIAETQFPSLAPITSSPTQFPSLAPITRAPTNEEQLKVACTFLSYTNLSACVGRTSIFIQNNSIGQTIPIEIGLLTQLTYLSLITTNLIGTIPSSLGNLTRLIGLDLSYNNLEGTIPAAIEYMTSLKFLLLGENLLNGNIPSSLGKLSSLEELEFGNNTLTGNIPPSLGDLIQLTYLSLWGNGLVGSIPSSLGDLTRLTVLDLSFNDLAGNVPSTLVNLESLVDLYLYNNTQLTGSIPSTICALQNISTIQIDCDNIACSCCLNRFENTCNTSANR